MIDKLLYKYFNGKATNAEIMQIMAWAEDSPENDAFLEKERKIYDAVLLHKNEEDIDEMLRRKSARKISLSRVVRRSISVAAAAAAVFVMVWAITLNRELNRMDKSTQIVSVPAGQRANITLPDGSSVWLNSLTTIEYPSSFNKADRTVQLNGQAYFDVTKNKNAPFIVKTGKGSIEVTGTRFDVMSYSNSEQFETTLMEGRVKVALNNEPGNYVFLTPDTKVSLHNGQLVKSYVSDYDPYRWREGLICFSEATFLQMLEQFEKTFDVRIIIDDKITGAVQYTGKFRMSEGLHYALRVLQKEINFTYSEDRENNIIHIKQIN